MRKIHLGLALASALAVAVLGASAARADQPATARGLSFTMFGKTYCVGEPTAPVRCDVRAGQAKPTLRLFGKTICLRAAPTLRCDLGPPARRQAAGLTEWIDRLRARSHAGAATHAANN
jgi:hypothetical protein